MSYLVYARKFRPQTFDEVIGQEPITTTLKNAITQGRIAQSFLFTGSRGVGKTSTARIFAKAINCEKGPTAEPCNRCVTCEEITRGSSLDILEIDGASNRGIDEIRDLRGSVKFKPAHGRYKVYIIDEVHMLTQEAFNALLKTLEEPPPHVKFIFATTEVHKVPLTILSRCQRFHFRRIPTKEIAEKLAQIARQEKLKVTTTTLFLVAKAAEGSLRDAESLLDQLASFGDSRIEESDVTDSLGLTQDEVYHSLLKSFQERDASKVLQIVHEATDRGKDLMHFSRGLLELFRDLLVFQLGGSSDQLIEGTEEYLGRLERFKDAFSREELLFSITLIQQLIRDLRGANIPRFLIESCLLKIVYRADLRSIDEMIRELKTIEEKGNRSKDPLPEAVSPPGAPAVTVALPKPNKKKDSFASETQAPPNKIEAPEAPAIRPADCSLGLADVERVWPDLLERVKAIKMSCGTYLSEAEPVEVVDGIAVFGFPVEFKFHKEALEQQEHHALICETLTALLGRPIGVSFVVTEADKTEQPHAGLEATSLPDSGIITSALNIFEGSKVIRRD